MQITRTALVPFPANRMYELVEDVASYPQFLSWCVSSKLIENSVDKQVPNLDISIAEIRQSIVTRNELVPGQRIGMELLEGPFQNLSGEWRFQELSSAGSKILLQLDFNFSGNLLSAAFRHGFASVADRLVNDFCLRAEAVYADSTNRT